MNPLGLQPSAKDTDCVCMRLCVCVSFICLPTSESHLKSRHPDRCHVLFTGKRLLVHVDKPGVSRVHGFSATGGKGAAPTHGFLKWLLVRNASGSVASPASVSATLKQRNQWRCAVLFVAIFDLFLTLCHEIPNSDVLPNDLLGVSSFGIFDVIR